MECKFKEHCCANLDCEDHPKQCKLCFWYNGLYYELIAQKPYPHKHMFVFADLLSEHIRDCIPEERLVK